MRTLALAIVVLATAISSAQIIDLCPLARSMSMGALGAREPDTPMTILNTVVTEAGWQLTEFELVPTTDSRVKHNALSQVCETEPHNFIFYDPTFLPDSPSPDGKVWVAYYVLAHEAGHIIKPATGKSRREKEQAADDWAGWATERIGAPVASVMAGVDYVATSENESVNYDSRCQRRMDALGGFNRGASLDGRPAYNQCLGCYPTPELGLYLKVGVSRGARMSSELVAQCGTGRSSDVPTDFERDVRNSCFMGDAAAGTQLTWKNIGLCSR